MVDVGDRIRLSLGKGPDREGVVVAVTGSMVRVRWPSGGETTLVPAPGTLSVLGSSGARTTAPRPARSTATAGKRTTTKTAGAKKGATKKSSGAKKSTTKKSSGAKKSTTRKRAGARRSR